MRQFQISCVSGIPTGSLGSSQSEYPEVLGGSQLFELTTEDLKNLRSVVEAGNLPVTQGFFYGSDTSQDDALKEKDLNFVKDALEAIDDGDSRADWPR